MEYDFSEVSLRTNEGVVNCKQSLWNNIYTRAIRESTLKYVNLRSITGNTNLNNNRENNLELPSISETNGIMRNSRSSNGSRNGWRNIDRNRLPVVDNSLDNLRNSHSSLNVNQNNRGRRKERKSHNIKLDPINNNSVNQQENNIPKKKKKKLTLDDLGNIALAAPYGDFKTTGIIVDPRSSYKISPYKPPRAPRKIILGGLDLSTKNQLREILAGLHYSIRKEIEKQQITYVELTRILKENRLIDERVTYGNLMTKQWVKGSEMILNSMTDYYDKYSEKKIDIKGGDLIKIVCCDSKGQIVLEPPKEGGKEESKANRIVEVASELSARVEVNEFFIECFFNEKVQLGFEEMLDVLDGRFKKEFLLRSELADLVVG